jgi:hypothetical protein
MGWSTYPIVATVPRTIKEMGGSQRDLIEPRSRTRDHESEKREQGRKSRRSSTRISRRDQSHRTPTLFSAPPPDVGTDQCRTNYVVSLHIHSLPEAESYPV